jgi:hypothetical protein
MKIDKFKFFTSNETKIDWGATGLLVDAINEELLIDVLNKTYNHITNNNLHEPRYSMLIIIMTKLFRDKLTSYESDLINYKINEVETMMFSPEISEYISDLQHNAWSGVDVEAEMTQIITERCNWVEE